MFALAAGVEIVYVPLSPVHQMIAAGVAGAQSVLVGLVIILMAGFTWFSPANRMLAGSSAGC